MGKLTKAQVRAKVRRHWAILIELADVPGGAEWSWENGLIFMDESRRIAWRIIALNNALAQEDEKK